VIEETDPENRAREKAAIVEVGLEALRRPDVDGLFALAAESLAEMLDVELTGVSELSPGGDELVLVAGVGWEPGEIGTLTFSAAPESQGGYTLVVCDPVAMDDIERERRFTVPESLRRHGVVSDLSVVIPGRARPFGMLAAHTRRQRTFSLADQSFVQAIANILSGAVERARAEQALRDSEAERRRILEAMLHAEEDERDRIAIELHDDTIQVMAATLLGLDRLAHALDAGDLERAEAAQHRASEALRAALERTRRLVFELRPPLLESQGLGPALGDLGAALEEETGIAAVVRADVPRLPLYVEEVAYRCVQEAVANVRKHARATSATITVAVRDDTLEAAVEDDGVGFDPDEAEHREGARLHIGLASVRERIRLAGGIVDVRSAPGRGARVCFTIPVLRDGDAPAPRTERPAARERRDRAA
jgi:signal transduction histidine kinase